MEGTISLKQLYLQATTSPSVTVHFSIPEMRYRVLQSALASPAVLKARAGFLEPVYAPSSWFRFYIVLQRTGFKD